MIDERALLRETAMSILDDHCTPERVSAAEDGWDAELWKRLEASSFTRIGVPEESGGAGGELADTATVVQAAAAAAAPIPLGDTLLVAAWLRHEVGLPHRNGPSTVAVLTDATVRVDGDAWVVAGTADAVPWARVADNILLVLPYGQGSTVVADVAAADLRVTNGRNVAGEPADRVTVQDVRVPMPCVGHGTVDLTSALRRRGALCRTVMLAGALNTLLSLTVQYAGERVQFGRTIAKFQAVKQQIAELAGEAAVASTAAQGAVTAAGVGPAHLPIVAARVRTAQAATCGARIAHQAHGAIGLTREHRLQHFTRRLWAWRDEYGTEGEWQRELGGLIVTGGADQLWPSLVS